MQHIMSLSRRHWRQTSRLGRWAFLALVLFVGCIPQYKPPTQDQPHAIVKFRRSYDNIPKEGWNAIAGSGEVVEVLNLNDERAFRLADPSKHVRESRTDAVLVHPGASEIMVGASFRHKERKKNQESYSCSSPIGPGSYCSPSTGTGGGYHMRSCTCYREVYREEVVADSSCKRTITASFEDGGVYLVQFNYQDARNCSAQCFRQVPVGDGEFKNEPCR